MPKSMPTFVIILLVSSLISSSYTAQAMDTDDLKMGAARTSQLKKTMDEAASRAASLRSEADKARFLDKECTDAINEVCNHCNSLSGAKLPEATKIINDRLSKLVPDVKNITDNVESADFLAAAFTGTGTIAFGVVSLNPLTLPVLGAAMGYAKYADNRDYNTMILAMRQKGSELNTSAQAAADRAAAATSLQVRAQSNWEVAVREEAVRAARAREEATRREQHAREEAARREQHAREEETRREQRAQEEAKRCAWIEASRKVTGQVVRSNLFNTEEAENFFGIPNDEAYNRILFNLDKTIHQLVCVFIYTLKCISTEFDNYYHKPQYAKEEFRNIINSSFSWLPEFAKNLYELINSRIVYSACDRLTHNDPDLTVMVLKNRNIDDRELQRICKILHYNQYLEELVLDSNKITDIGVASLCALLKKNTNLIKLSLCNNQVTDEGLKAVQDALKYNRNLISLHMGGNLILRHELCKVDDVNGNIPVNSLIPIHPREDRLIKKFVTFLKEYFITKVQPQRIDSKKTDPQMELEWIR